MTIAVYIVGAPGSGKSTMTAKLVETWLEPRFYAEPVAHLRYPNGWTQLGKDRPIFPGTDTLPHNAITRTETWLNSPDRPTNLIAEGDRLAIDRFIRCLHNNYDHVHVIHLTADPAISYERMLQRAEQHNRKPQNEAWWRGRATKAANLAARWNATELDARKPAQTLAEELAALL